ncbi:MAG: DUF4954 family protein [Planctomycetia bacterium]|nr:DUF4954 family protein [Planctomycetia bacterium]
MPSSLDLVARVRELLRQSELLRAVTAVRQDGGLALALDAAVPRLLTETEVRDLEARGNVCADWQRVRVADPFDPRRIQHSSFAGDVCLGVFQGDAPLSDGVAWPTGIYRSTLVDCIIGHEALVRDVRLLARYVIGPEAVLWDCGRIVCITATCFGNGGQLAVGIEVGGRQVPLYAELDVEVAARVAQVGDRGEPGRGITQAVAEYAEAVRSERGIIERGAAVRNTAEIIDAYLGPAARVEGATRLQNSTLLSSPDEPTCVASGACVRDSLLQWGSHAATLALVEQSVLTEHSHVERHGKVLTSILGPNTGVAEGEVTASLLGPFVGFHHQSMLIAAVWPEGRGNVAAGANVGSNHTSRAPDQEFWPGEGAYLGLGVNIKYPADFRQAPYTIIATGVITLPQQLAFPFSLINKPSLQHPDISPAYNEIVPAWVLLDNLYMIRRNEAKFRRRNQARRTAFDFAVFRPEIVELMRVARQRLEAVAPRREIYTDLDIPGLGKNFLLEKHRQAAVEGYGFHMAWYALMGLKERLEALLQQDARADWMQVLQHQGTDAGWEHQRRILVEDLHAHDPVVALAALPAMLERIAREVERSKSKDDRRGQRIFEDYNQVHVLADRDAFVSETRQAMAAHAEATNRLLADLARGA